MPGIPFRQFLEHQIVDLKLRAEQLEADIDDTNEELAQCRKHLAEVIEDEKNGL